ncbi:ABC transporter permease [Lactococcus nasutitermitis]|uniref:ABC transporter permease n=1 Tax=Lactococcus nasutitermitis TaxID=1652957 RepID=A0ABV9JB12_9LACT|nr:ABC transporter permease [Lactococcus nasutitermitis]
MSNFNQLWLVAKNAYRNRLKSFSFWALVIGPLMIPIIGIAVTFLTGVNQTPKLAVVNQSTIVQVLKTNKSLNATVTSVDTHSKAETKLKNGDIDGFLTVNKTGHYTLTTSSKSSNALTASSLVSALTTYQIAIKSREMNLNSAQVTALLTPAQVSSVTKNAQGQTQDERSTGANTAITMFSVIFIFLFLTLYVGVISQEIANEKSNRIMEILLSTTNSRVQYYGKIVGVLLLALTQLAIYIVGGVGLYLAFKDNSAVKSVLGMVHGVNAAFLVYVAVTALVAIFSYLILASIVASLVNEQAQAQQATLPVTYLALIGYIGGIALGINPANLFLQGLSFVPFISPTMMTGRLASQTVGWGEALLALGLQLVAMGLVAHFGERIYERNVLSYSSEKIIRQLFNNIRGKDTVVKQKNINQRLGKKNRLIIIVVIIVLVLLYHLFFKK